MLKQPKLPAGQSLVRCEEGLDGNRVALARVSSALFATYTVLPSGYLDDPAFDGTIVEASGRFENRLMAA